MIDHVARFNELYPSYICHCKREQAAVRQLAAEIRREAMQECAEICDILANLSEPDDFALDVLRQAAAAIRARMEPKRLPTAAEVRGILK